MPMGVFDFKAIANKLNCNEQKADFEGKNPKPDPNKVVWSPEYGYGMAPYGLAQDAYSGNVQNQYQTQAASGLFGKPIK